MNMKISEAKVVPFTVLAVMTLTLCGGCAPIAGEELGSFARELLLSAASAFFL